MGNCECKIKELEEKENENSNLCLSDFKLLYPIGRGGYGRVWKVRLKRQYNNNISDVRLYKNKSRIFAMKEMNKAKIYYKKSLQSVANERKFLSIFNYPLLCNMHFAFQNNDYLYIIMDYLSGGDLRYQICKRPFFSEEDIKFVSSCILLSLEYIHKKNIIHRDLKPENLVFDNNGYLHLTDFGIAMEYIPGKELINSSGTPGYIAPEVIINKNHDFLVDYFALGVIIYELMLGERPYTGKTRKEIKEQMLAGEVKISVDDLPDDFTDENIVSLVNKLLKRKKSKRLGAKGIIEIKNHLWFKNVNWESIENGSFLSPFVFENEDNFDNNYANKEEDETIYEGNKEEYILEVNKSRIFENFYYNIEENNIEKNSNEKSIPKNLIKNTDAKSFRVSSNSRNNTIQVKKDENLIINDKTNMKLSLDYKEFCPINKVFIHRKSVSHISMGDNTNNNNLLNCIKNKNNENEKNNDIEIHNIEENEEIV